MPGSFIFKPIEANLTRDTEFIGKMAPYCSFKIGDQVSQSEVCKKGGKHPHWDKAITMKTPSTNESLALVQVMDKSTFTSDDTIGTFSVDLNEIQAAGHMSKWYPIYFENKPAGELLLQSKFKWSSELPTETTSLVEGETTSQTSVSGSVSEHKTYQEQKQVVEPRTFVKEVDVVETQSKMQEIEVMEPVTVTKDVQYTEVVPVTKQIETVEPQVVKKQVEVMEPQLVTKTIQVVENVPVTKEVEVIENKTVMKDVETFEPQTFTKQVEVTEQVPVKKQVEVSEPVHLKKQVEFVEPVITTKTITKEIPETVIVNEKVKTTVGPATMVLKEQNVIASESTEKNLIEKDISEKNIFEGNLLEKNVLESEITRKKGTESELLKDKDYLEDDYVNEERL